MFGIGSQELMVIFLIVLLLFGAQKLPELARGLGRSVKEFRKASEGGGYDDEPSKPPSPAAAASASRSCGSCKAPLEPDWTHCPRCGALAGQAAAPQT